MGEATLRVETGNVQEQIADAAADATLLIIGATEKGVLSRLVRGSLVLDVLENVDCSVLLTEKRNERTLKERIFGVKGASETPADTGITPDQTSSEPEVDEEK